MGGAGRPLISISVVMRPRIWAIGSWLRFRTKDPVPLPTTGRIVRDWLSYRANTRTDGPARRNAAAGLVDSG